MEKNQFLDKICSAAIMIITILLFISFIIYTDEKNKHKQNTNTKNLFAFDDNNENHSTGSQIQHPLFTEGIISNYGKIDTNDIWKTPRQILDEMNAYTTYDTIINCKHEYHIFGADSIKISGDTIYLKDRREFIIVK